MSNISKVKKNQCTGCGACKNVCPYDAITMLPDTYGFLYPNVDLNKCTNHKLQLPHILLISSLDHKTNFDFLHIRLLY